MKYKVSKVSEEKEWKDIPYWELEVQDEEGHNYKCSIWRKGVIIGEIVEGEMRDDGKGHLKLVRINKQQGLPPDPEDVNRRIRQGFASSMIEIFPSIGDIDKLLELWKELEPIYYNYVKDGKKP